MVVAPSILFATSIANYRCICNHSIDNLQISCRQGRQPVRAQSGCFRHCPNPLGNVPAEIEFQSIVPLRRSLLASPFGGGAHRIYGFCGRRGLFCCFYPLSHALWRASSPMGRAKCCRLANSNLTATGTNREGPMVCRRLPAFQARAVTGHCPINPNLIVAGTNRESPMVC